MEIPVITPHQKEAWSYKVRKGLKFEFSGRMCEPEIILNSNTTGKPGAALGLGELCQLAAFCGLTGYEQYINPGTVRKYNPVICEYRQGWGRGWWRHKEGYTPANLCQYYSHDDHPGYTRIDIMNFVEQPRPYEIQVRNKWGHNRADKVTLYPEDLQALIPFMVANVSESCYEPGSEREYLEILGVPMSKPRGR
jgi:hypothetical protein